MELQSRDQSLFELIAIFRDKIAKFDTSKYGKSAEKAAELRKKGNDFFASSQYEDAIEMYTEATFQAPLLGDTEELALAIANRSASFYRLSRYKECIKDIDMAIKYGYPSKSRIKLLVRKNACENELQKLITSPATNSNGTASSGSSESQTECEQIESRKFAMIEENERKGKSLLASENISSGSLVLAESPYMAVVHSHNLTKYCYHCLRKIRKLSQPFPCLTCNQVRFCSGLCSTMSRDYHKVECCYLSIFNITKDFHVSPKITLKAILKQGLTDCLAINTGSADVSDGYAGFLDLIEHPNEDKNDYSVPASIIAAFLIEQYPYEIFTRNVILRLVDRVMKHFRQVNVNGITIMAKDVVADEEKEAVYEESNVGCGVYLTARLINHSCDPNTRITKFDGDRLFIHAVRDIRVGEEITFSYGGSYKWQLLSVRKNMLRESYFFDCTCSACEQGLQPLTNAIACPDCKGPVVSEKSMTCMQCGKSDHVDLKKIIGDTSACMRVIALGTSLVDSPTPGTNNCEIAIKTLTEARKTLSHIVYKTHTELWKVDQKLVTCFLKDKKYDEAFAHSKQVYEHLAAQFHPTYYRVFNSLLSLVRCQVLYYQQLKSSPPIDKNRVNIIKTETHRNVDLLETIFKLISGEDDHAIRQRILAARQILCPFK